MACVLCLKLPGHKGTVTAVDFHPKEPISAYFSIDLFEMWIIIINVGVYSSDGKQGWYNVTRRD